MEQVAGFLDLLRSELLRVTLSFEPLRVVFVNRALRLAALFLASAGVSLWLSLQFPLWVLALGPAVYGVPHLFATVRYFHHANAGRSRGAGAWRRGLYLAVLPMALIPVYRIVVSINWFELPVARLSEWSGSVYLEFLALLAVFFAGLWIYGLGWRGLPRGLALLTPLAIAFWLDPIATIGALVLIHNFVAFAYWVLAARSRTERGVAALAGTAVLGVTGLIFFGFFDGWVLESLRPAETLPFANLGFEELGALIVPWSDAPRAGLHAAIAYAFGQSMHYFVWLKAIPDQCHANEVPTSFRQSLRLLEGDFGLRAARWMVLISALSIGMWCFLAFPQARLLYFAVAGFHGYLEIAGLGLAAGRSAARCRPRGLHLSHGAMCYK